MSHTPFSLFHNRLRIMLNIDKVNLDDAIGETTTMDEWREFSGNPWRWFITVDTRRAEKVFRLIEYREERWAAQRAAVRS